MRDAHVVAMVTRLQAAIAEEDLDAIDALYADSYVGPNGLRKANVRDYFSGLFANRIFRNAKFDNSELEVRWDDGRATLGPVIYRLSYGTLYQEYEVTFAADEPPAIVASAALPSPPPARPPAARAKAVESRLSSRFMADAGLLVERHAMVWMRRVEAPIDLVWAAISTKEGLARWWVVPPSKFELRRGGAFDHHWSNIIVDWRDKAFIDFRDNTGAYQGTGGMRLEISEIDATTTMFTFLGTFSPDYSESDSVFQPGGPGTPGVGIAVGWHVMVDKLAGLFDEEFARSAPARSELHDFYTGYLRDMYRWNEAVQRSTETDDF